MFKQKNISFTAVFILKIDKHMTILLWYSKSLATQSTYTSTSEEAISVFVILYQKLQSNLSCVCLCIYKKIKIPTQFQYFQPQHKGYLKAFLYSSLQQTCC